MGTTILGGAVGLVTGLLLGLSSPVRAAARPSVKALPYLVYIALGVALPRSSTPFQGPPLIAVAVCALTLSAIAELDDRYWDLARHFGAGPSGLIQTIALPGAGPTIVRRLLVTAAIMALVAIGGTSA